MPQFIDRTGWRYGRLTVVERFPNEKGKQTKWLCKCDCGNTVIVQSGSLTSGKTMSCGCYHRDSLTKHGMATSNSRHPLYSIWNSMISRCENPNARDYKNYGGRGVKICCRWRDVKNFIEDMYPSWEKGLQIDRIDNDGDYEPSNCRWVTPRENTNHRRTTIYVRGVPATVLADESGISADTIRKRVRSGWGEEDMLLPPNKTNRVNKVVKSNETDYEMQGHVLQSQS